MAIRVFSFVVLVSSVLYANAKIVEELKSNTGDVSLSINIPSLALSDILGGKKTTETRQKIKANNETTSANSEEKDDAKAESSSKGSKSLDLAKLLSSGTPVSIKSTETSTMGEKGNTEKSVKEIAIDTMGSGETKSNNKQGAQEGQQFDDKTMQKLVSALKPALFNTNTNANSNTNATSSNQNAEEVNAPSSGLTEGKTSKAVEAPKDGKELKTKDKASASETSNAAGESKPASEGAKASKQSSGSNQGNQIALVPVSLPSSVLSQLQSALNGGNNNNNMSAASPGGNSSGAGNMLPGLASLLGQASNANGNNNNTSEMSNAHNDTNASVTHNAFNETSSMTNNTGAEAQEGSKIKNEEEHNHYGENQSAKQVDLATTASNPAKKDTPVLVVIPQITNTARDLTESKSGFFSKKVTSSRVRGGLHKKSKLKYKKNE